MLRQRLGGWEGGQNVLDYFSRNHLFSYLLFRFLSPDANSSICLMWPCSSAPSLLELWVPSTDYHMGPTLYTFLKLRGGQTHTHTHRDAHTHQIWNSSTYSSVTLKLPCCPLTVSLAFSSWPSPNKAIESLQLLSAFSRILTLFSGFSFSDTFSLFFRFMLFPFSTEKVKKSERKATQQKMHEKWPARIFFLNVKSRRERGLKSWHEEKGTFAVIYGKSCCPNRGDEFPQARAAGGQGSQGEPAWQAG